jgi:predicted alpha/beta superfamily hydrolase
MLSTLTGNVRRHWLRSRFLERRVRFLVLLPPDYDPASVTRYPVLYVQDGQNVFDRATSIGDEWGLDETALRLMSEGQVAPLIIVAIYHAGKNRVEEYTPTRIEKHGGGRSAQYAQMLLQELKPLVDRKYNTLPSAASIGLCGSSLGGLVTLNLALKHPTAFNRIAALSPSIWWDNRLVVREVGKLTSKLPLRIWLDAGTAEGDEVIQDTRAMRDALVAKGWQLGHDLHYMEAEGGGHNEASWGVRVATMLKFLFPPNHR